MSYFWESAKLLIESEMPEVTGDRKELENIGTIDVAPAKAEKWYFPKEMFAIEYLSDWCKCEGIRRVTGTVKEMLLCMVHCAHVLRDTKRRSNLKNTGIKRKAA